VRSESWTAEDEEHSASLRVPLLAERHLLSIILRLALQRKPVSLRGDGYVVDRKQAGAPTILNCYRRPVRQRNVGCTTFAVP